MLTHHLKLNLDKTKLLSLPGTACPIHDLSINIELFGVYVAQMVRNLGVTLADQLSLAANIAATTRSCRLILHNINRISLFLTPKALQVLVQVLLIS